MAAVPGISGQLRVVATHAASDARLEVYLHGATVTSFTHQGQELFFLSELAIFDGTKSIRGGNPIVWPQFAGQGPLAPHGFARVTHWELISVGDGHVELRLSHEHVAPAVRALWPHAFELTLRLTFEGPALRSELRVCALDDSPLLFDALQHAYLRLGDAALPSDGLPGAAAVHGVKELHFLDIAAAREGGGVAVEESSSETLALGGDVERIYVSAGGRSVVLRGVCGPSYDAVRVDHRATIRDVSSHEEVPVTSELVVFKPSAQRAASIGGFAPEDWRRFVAIEPGCVTPAAAVALAPNKIFCLDVSYTMTR